MAKSKPSTVPSWLPTGTTHLKRSAGRPRTMRFKGCTEKGGKMSGRHKCPICKTYGHHWHNCKEGDPAQVAAMLAERGPPKKRRKKTNPPTSATSTVVAPIVAPIMTYPPSPPVHSAEKTRTNNNSSTSSKSARSRSLTGSNQPESSNMIVPLPTFGEQTTSFTPKKAKCNTKRKSPSLAALDSPAMRTRSKRNSPAMATRSKKKKLMD